MTSRLPEFAEEHSAAARIRILLIGVVAGGALLLASEAWLLPWIRGFASVPPCAKVLGVDGLTFLWYGLFVGIPLIAAGLTAATLGLRGRRILRDGQVPPIGEKVFRTTRIRRGAAAVLAGRLHMAACMPFLVLAAWGFFQAHDMTATMRARPGACLVPH